MERLKMLLGELGFSQPVSSRDFRPMLGMVERSAEVLEASAMCKDDESHKLAESLRMFVDVVFYGG